MRNVFRDRKEAKRDGRAHLGLDVEGDQAVCHQVVDGLEPLLAHKVLPIVVEAEVPGLVAEPEGSAMGGDIKRLSIGTRVDFSGCLYFTLVFHFC